MTRDQTMPDGRWEFDAAVTDAFDDMLARSIPDHQGMRDVVTDLALRHLTGKGRHVLDLGCSRGQSISYMRDRAPESTHFTGLEVSAPMLAAARDRFKTDVHVTIREHDLRTPLPPCPGLAVALSVLTLQFTPIEHRARIVQDVYDQLPPDGAFLLVEKVLAPTAPLDRLLVDAYLDHKRTQGYTDEQIARKRLSLEGVLVPVTARWNEDLLHAAGFRHVDCAWRHLNFAAWIATP